MEVEEEVSGISATSAPKTKCFRVPSKLEVIGTSVAAGIAVGALSLLVEQYVEQPAIPFRLINLSDQLIAGLITAICIFILRHNSRRRRLIDRQRYELISESTKQIRGALQLITDSAVPGSQQQHVVIYAVDHIEWVLQEVLPAVHQDPKEVRERVKEYS